MFTKIDYSGAPKIMAWVANELARAGHEVTLLSYFFPQCDQPLDPRVSFECLGVQRSCSRLVRNTAGMLRTVTALDRFMAKKQPDLVITFLDSVGYVYLLYNKLHHKFKCVASERVDPYHYHGLVGKIRAYLLRFAHGFVFQTAGARDFYAKNPHIAAHSVIIPNPIVLHEGTEALRVLCDQRDRRICSVGRLGIRQKRQDVLLRAFQLVHAQVPDVTLHLYGDGPDRDQIQALIEELGLAGCAFLEGRTSEVEQVLHNARLFVLSSDFEGIPNALIEAMMLGVPSVTTDCSPGGARLLVQDGVNGFLVPCGDVQALARRMMDLLESDSLSDSFSRASVQIGTQFSESAISAQWQDFLKQIQQEEGECQP